MGACFYGVDVHFQNWFTVQRFEVSIFYMFLNCLLLAPVPDNTVLTEAFASRHKCFFGYDGNCIECAPHGRHYFVQMHRWFTRNSDHKGALV